MNRSVALFVFLVCGIALQHSHGIEVNVTNKDGKLCLYANLMANFSVSYEIAGNKTATAEFELPSSATSEGSECGAKDSLLKLNFGDGHSWSINFTLSGQTYKADLITFSYNLGDKTVFPNSASNDTQTATTTPHIDNVGFDTCYSCKSKDKFETTSVNQTLWNVLMQAFVSNDSKSEQITSCAADLPTTTVAPTTSTTTAAPVTNATSTTPPPTTTPTPTPTLPTPATGKYEVKSGVNDTACLLATVGLRIGLKQGDKYVEMNVNPDWTSASGSCGVNSSELLLESNTTSFMFTFTNDSKKFHLHALNVTGKTSSGVMFSEVNTNLSLWEAAISSSYMCNKEQNYTITGQLTLFTFDLHIQPFGVKKGAFSTAHECSLDDTSILIPIIVGAALAGLILIVVVAYVIGRRKTYVGYQTL